MDARINCSRTQYTSFLTYILRFRAVYVRLSAQIRKCDSENTSLLLRCRDQELKMYDPADSVLEEDTEPEPKPKKRIMTA